VEPSLAFWSRCWWTSPTTNCLHMRN